MGCLQVFSDQRVQHLGLGNRASSGTGEAVEGQCLHAVGLFGAFGLLVNTVHCGPRKGSESKSQNEAG